MNLFKRADGGITVIVVIVILLIFIGWLVEIGSKECRNDGDCRSNSYCGSDFACHQFPVTEKTTGMVEYSLTLPLLIVCITAVALALIFRWDKIRPPKRQSEEWITVEAK